VRAPFYLFHATPSFRGATAGPDLEPSHMPSLESQIIVLETLTNAWPVILVIDMVIFSGKASHSETPVEIPWSEWGPQYTCCFRHHSSCQISVFGSKMAYALPRHVLPRALTLDLTPKGLCTETSFCVHILDFNQRVIARAENIYDPNLPIHLICKPSNHSYGPVISNRPYIATICHTQFSSDCFAKLFLEDNRLTLTWVGVPNYGFSDGLTRPNRSCGMARFIFRLFPLCRWRTTRTLYTRISISSRGNIVVNFFYTLARHSCVLKFIPDALTAMATVRVLGNAWVLRRNVSNWISLVERHPHLTNFLRHPSVGMFNQYQCFSIPRFSALLEYMLLSLPIAQGTQYSYSITTASRIGNLIVNGVLK
jgi:hypothetical protein